MASFPLTNCISSIIKTLHFLKKSLNTFESSQSINPDEYKKIKETILRAANSSDYLEAQNAFKEKRSPNFSGK